MPKTATTLTLVLALAAGTHTPKSPSPDVKVGRQGARPPLPSSSLFLVPQQYRARITAIDLRAMTKGVLTILRARYKITNIFADKRLSSALSRLLAPKTWRDYVNKFTAFTAAVRALDPRTTPAGLRLSPLPASARLVEYVFAHRRDALGGFLELDSYARSINFFHSMIGFPSPLSPATDRFRRRASEDKKRSGPVRKAEALTARQHTAIASLIPGLYDTDPLAAHVAVNIYFACAVGARYDDLFEILVPHSLLQRSTSSGTAYHSVRFVRRKNKPAGEDINIPRQTDPVADPITVLDNHKRRYPRLRRLGCAFDETTAAILPTLAMSSATMTEVLNIRILPKVRHTHQRTTLHFMRRQRAQTVGSAPGINPGHAAGLILGHTHAQTSRTYTNTATEGKLPRITALPMSTQLLLARTPGAGKNAKA